MTNEQLVMLSEEAAMRGEDSLVELCQRAIDGDAQSREELEREGYVPRRRGGNGE